MDVCINTLTHPVLQLGKYCQELLMAVATNCTTHQADDLKVIESLLAIRLKTKLFSNQFVACIRYIHVCTLTYGCIIIVLCYYCRELISSHPSNLETVLRGVVNNELGQLRSPSNIALLAMMMHSWPDEAPKVCVCVCVHEVVILFHDYSC